MKIAVVGSRNIKDVDFVENTISKYDFDEVISGGAIGIDTIAKNYAIKKGIKVNEILPNYNKFGKAAPIIRNKEIIDKSDFILIFWDGKSKGTQFVIQHCKKIRKKCLILVV